MIIPANYPKHRNEFSWEQIHWAYDIGIIDWKYLVEKAVDQLRQGNDDPIEVELASLSKADAGNAGEILTRLTFSKRDESAKLRWLCVLVSWIFEIKDEINNPFEILESVYADFGYPSEISAFIRYMPTQDSYNPAKHSYEENMLRLVDNWRKYVNSC